MSETLSFGLADRTTRRREVGARWFSFVETSDWVAAVINQQPALWCSQQAAKLCHRPVGEGGRVGGLSRAYNSLKR